MASLPSDNSAYVETVRLVNPAGVSTLIPIVAQTLDGATQRGPQTAPAAPAPTAPNVTSLSRLPSMTLAADGASGAFGGAFKQAYVHPTAAGGESEVGALKESVRQLEVVTRAEIRELRAQISDLSRALHSHSQSSDLPPGERIANAISASSKEQVLSVLGGPIVGDDWADYFDYVADYGAADPHAVEDVAVIALKSTDGAVRSAAARALAARPSERSKLEIQAAVDNEDNARVLVALRSALETANL